MAKEATAAAHAECARASTALSGLKGLDGERETTLRTVMDSFKKAMALVESQKTEMGKVRGGVRACVRVRGEHDSRAAAMTSVWDWAQIKI